MSKIVVNDGIFSKTCIECGGSGMVYSALPNTPEWGLYEKELCLQCHGTGLQEDPFPECTCEDDHDSCPIYAWLDRQGKLKEEYEQNDNVS